MAFLYFICYSVPFLSCTDLLLIYCYYLFIKVNLTVISLLPDWFYDSLCVCVRVCAYARQRFFGKLIKREWNLFVKKYNVWHFGTCIVWYELLPMHHCILGKRKWGKKQERIGGVVSPDNVFIMGCLLSRLHGGGFQWAKQLPRLVGYHRNHTRDMLDIKKKKKNYC